MKSKALKELREVYFFADAIPIFTELKDLGPALQYHLVKTNKKGGKKWVAG